MNNITQFKILFLAGLSSMLFFANLNIGVCAVSAYEEAIKAHNKKAGAMEAQGIGKAADQSNSSPPKIGMPLSGPTAGPPQSIGGPPLATGLAVPHNPIIIPNKLKSKTPQQLDLMDALKAGLAARKKAKGEPSSDPEELEKGDMSE